MPALDAWRVKSALCICLQPSQRSTVRRAVKRPRYAESSSSAGDDNDSRSDAGKLHDSNADHQPIPHQQPIAQKRPTAKLASEDEGEEGDTQGASQRAPRKRQKVAAAEGGATQKQVAAGRRWVLCWTTLLPNQQLAVGVAGVSLVVQAS